MKPLRRLLHFFLYSNLFIAGIAVLMGIETGLLTGHPSATIPCLRFIFFSTICSYGFHYFFTETNGPASARKQWISRQKNLLGFFFLAGLAGMIITFIPISQHGKWIIPAGIATFLYTAPQLPLPVFRQLRKIAYGKTIFLALIWTYATTLLPVMTSDLTWTPALSLFTAARYCLVYCICILFDLRDREADQSIGVKSLVTWLNDRSIAILFAISWLLALIGFVWLSFQTGHQADTVFRLIPLLPLPFLYSYARQHPSDWLYDIVLDGLLGLSAVLMLLARI